MLGVSLGRGSRRWFLRLTAGLGAGVASAPHAWADVGHGEDDLQSGTAGMGLDSAEVSAAIDLALKNVSLDGIDHFFPAPFELDRLSANSRLRERLVAHIADALLSSANEALSIEAVYIPKSAAHAYRRAGWIEPIDLLTFLTCAILVASRVEPTRLPAQRVFSNRFSPQAGRLFDARYDFSAFHAAVAQRLEAKPGTVLVSADIADCYDSICSERLAQSLVRRGAEPSLVAMLDRLLRDWRGTAARGLPAGSHASSILAESLLGDIDDRLQEDGIDHIRFVDDYRLFAPDAATARVWLQRLDAHLAAERLRLNHSKTSIQSFTGEQYESFRRIRRAAQLWGRPGRDRILSVAQGNGNPQSPPPPPAGPNGGQQKTSPVIPGRPRIQMSSDVLRYRKTPLQEEDAELVRGIDVETLLSDLKRRAAQDAYVPLGELRLLVEATLATKSYARLPEILELLAATPHGTIFMADVLEICRNEIPTALRAAAAEWYGGRLLEGALPTKFEALLAAHLLGTDGYEAPQILRAYLEAEEPASPLMQRALLEGIRKDCDGNLAQSLLDRCDQAAPQTQRVLLDVAWPHLDAAQRSDVARRYAARGRRDPFIAALFESA